MEQEVNFKINQLTFEWQEALAVCRHPVSSLLMRCVAMLYYVDIKESEIISWLQKRKQIPAENHLFTANWTGK
jgi:hypothetical protein